MLLISARVPAPGAANPVLRANWQKIKGDKDKRRIHKRLSSAQQRTESDGKQFMFCNTVNEQKKCS